MNKLLCCLAMLFSVFTAQAQKEHFVYVQSEAGVPFFIRMGEQTFTSSSKGYLILSKLRDSSYSIRVGWPSAPNEQAYFTLQVAGKDRGLILKQFSGEGWGLYDLQSMEIIKGQAAPNTNSAIKLEPKEHVSRFTDVLAKASNDPTLRMREVVQAPVNVKNDPPGKKEEVKDAVVVGEKKITEETRAVDSTATPQLKEAVAVKPLPAPGNIEPTHKEEVKPGVVAEKPVVIAEKPLTVEVKPAVDETKVVALAEEKKDSLNTKEEVVAVLKETPGIVDTKEKGNITIGDASGAGVSADLSPSTITRKSESSTTEGFSIVYWDEYASGKKDTIRITIPHPKATVKDSGAAVATDKKFLEIPVNVSDTATLVKEVIRNKCIYKATESDFLSARKKMAAASSDDGMIREAKKAMEKKCFTVQQVRNLAALFLNDAGKFQFFEMSTAYISNMDQVEKLGDDLKNEYYQRRFKTVLEKLYE